MAKTLSLSAVTATGTGTGFMWGIFPKANVTLTVVTSGSPTAGQVALQVSNGNGTTWTTVDTWVAGTDASGTPKSYHGSAVHAARANCTVAPSGGSSPTLSAYVVGI